MDIEADPIAIVILEILDELLRAAHTIKGPDLLRNLRDRTGDDKIQPYHIKDTVEILRVVKTVRVFTSMGPLTLEYGFDDVWITPFGRNKLKSIRVSRAFKPAGGNEQPTIKVEGDVHGDVIQAYKGDVTKININSYAELIDAIKAEKTLSPYGKEETIKNINLIKEEIKKEQPDIGVIRRSWNWIKEHGPRMAEGVLIRLIPPLIMSQLN